MSIIVVDNFYNDPDAVRDFALKQEFNLTGGFPAVRGGYYFPEETLENIKSIIKPFGGAITGWTGNYGVFQLCKAEDRSWIHGDAKLEDPSGMGVWAGVVYLTPDAPMTAGTCFYKHKETGKRIKDEPFFHSPDSEKLHWDSIDYTKWELADSVANVYNRAIFYRGDMFHCAGHYFGHTKENARLTQTFFFFTQK